MNSNVNEKAESKKGINRELRIGITIALFAVQWILIALLIYEILSRRVFITEENHALVNMDIICMVIASFFSLSIMRSRRDTVNMYAFLLLIFFDTLHLASDGLFRALNGDADYWLWTGIAENLYLICPILMIMTYWGLLDIWDEKGSSKFVSSSRFIVIVGVIELLLILGNVLFNYYSGVDDSGRYYRGDFFALTIVFPVIMIVPCIVRILMAEMKLTERLILLSFPLVPIGAAAGQYLLRESAILTVGIFLAVALVYTNFFTMKETELSDVGRDLAVSRLYFLQNQMNPHMIYNTMSSIAGMCDINPGMAQEMIYKFSDYMRDNITDVDKSPMISLREELVHLDRYMEIESMRFPRIEIVKDIKNDSFLLPAMSLQPLVENAIKHGIHKRRRSEGTITITSGEKGEYWTVSVIDNGVGFDEKLISGSMDGHHGIYNVRMRLAMLCDGRLEVHSEKDKGTEATIFIPKWGGYYGAGKTLEILTK